jgi:hypothetical protein
MKYNLKSNYSIYEIIQILSVSAFDKTTLVNQNVKELHLIYLMMFNAPAVFSNIKLLVCFADFWDN